MSLPPKFCGATRTRHVHATWMVYGPLNGCAYALLPPCRLDLLRKIVPHAERANTACFLEEVIKYIDSLKRRNEDLEKHVRLGHWCYGACLCCLGVGLPITTGAHMQCMRARLACTCFAHLHVCGRE